MDLKSKLLIWLGGYRDHLPSDAVTSLQALLNPEVVQTEHIQPNQDLKDYGWSFGTYFKLCPDCPQKRIFMGSANSIRCQPHALERFTEENYSGLIVPTQFQ